MRYGFNLLLGRGVAIIASLGVGTSLAVAADCSIEIAESLGVAEVTIADVVVMPQGEESPLAHCVITGATEQRTGTDGMDYAITFELRLPNDWNGRFVHQFNGGNDGSVVPAIGPLLGSDDTDTALARGYAVVSSDAGHRGDAFPDAGLAGGARFGMDEQARRNYGYAAVETLNPLAVDLVESYYGEPIAYSYGVGGSNGGRHAMVAAVRLPDSFDGLLIGYPGFNLPKAAIQHAWDVQAFRSVSDRVGDAFSQEDLTLVADAILDTCDDLDGLADGIIGDADACQHSFDIASLECGADGSNLCLSAEQVTALRQIHQGPVNSDGEALYSSWLWDHGIASGDWRFWKLESPIPPWGNNSLIMVMGSASLAQIFTSPPTAVGGTPDELEQYLIDFDFDTDAPKIFAATDEFSESAMEFMTPPSADDPELAEFRDSGGKMLVFHGSSDPVFSVVDTTNWYLKLDENNGGDAEEFARFYRVPGMPHGAGGPSTDDFDVFSPLVAWVEKGEAPDAIVAGVSEANQEAAAAGLAGITRKLCPYPGVPMYTGSDPDSSDSFTCE